MVSPVTTLLRLARTVACLIVVSVACGPAYALDPPHNETNDLICTNCHTPHHANGGAITKVNGNPNLCMSCHTSGGIAAARPFADVDQAFPGQVGTSHRFDSGVSGHVEAATSNGSTGKIESAGAFSGRIERTFTITIATGGNVGTATFNWSDGAGGSGSGVSGANVALANGLTLAFTNGTASPSFVSGNVWSLFVRTDLRSPSTTDSFETPMAIRLASGKVVCSVCHNQHSQEKTPADPDAPPYAGAGTGAGRHFQRQDNDANQMCHVCHSVRNVQSSAGGSHPVGVSVPSSGFFRTPPSLELVQGLVDCTSCHSPHFTSSGGANGGAGDGYLLDLSIRNLCYDCHTIGDQATASHLNSTTGALWPGGQYGSSFPAHSTEKRGMCVNCHWPHGWPDATTPAQDYPKLWVERYDVDATGRTDPSTAENLCFTCHDGSPAATDVRAQFNKGTNGTDVFHHPVNDSEQSSGRAVECVSCHNPHRATSTNKLKGVTGIDLTGAAVGPGTANDRDVTEYEVCFKCHGDTFNSARSGTTNKRLDLQVANSAFHPVAGAGRNRSVNLNEQLLAGLTTTSTITCTDCHNNEATADAQGRASNSTQRPKGPHGSTNAAIRRAAYPTTLTGPSSWNANNFALCYLCHNSSRHTARRWGDGARTNFYDDINGKDNLHWVHLVDRANKARATCKNCHYNVHSNVTASNTQYRIDGVLTTTPPPGAHTHLVSFSPDVAPIGTRTRPEWWLNTITRERRCYLSCHTYTMNGEQYRPARPGVTNGGDDNPTSP